MTFHSRSPVVRCSLKRIVITEDPAIDFLNQNRNSLRLVGTLVVSSHVVTHTALPPLSEVVACSGLDIQEISNLTGIPTGKSSGKVEPMICYAEYMGIITKEKRNGLYKLNTRILPSFLSPKTIELVEKLRIEADQIVSEGMIEDVVFYFNKLSPSEKKQCLDILLHQD